ncbi:hypothetical protein [Vibrio parahaemolyticus]|uniref:hypothetical protein n=1 Tax=Vibrio parahaemolyticus TaxID=670 RepID=UPI0023600AD8|nr:hypothetical protein [Vibrio parahaemolyticus]
MKRAIFLLCGFMSASAMGFSFDKTQTSYDCGDYRVQIMSDSVVFVKFPNKSGQEEFIVTGQFRDKPIITGTVKANWGDDRSKWFFSFHRYDTPQLSGAWLRPDSDDDWSLLTAFSTDCRVL